MLTDIIYLYVTELYIIDNIMISIPYDLSIYSETSLTINIIFVFIFKLFMIHITS